MRRIILAVLPLAVLLLSCKPDTGGGRDTISLVKYIATDTASPEHALLASFAKVPASGDISLVGTPDACARISRDFVECDVFENARGRDWGDGLKDFAGETFASICDPQLPCGDERLRELAVRYALAALSRKCNSSVYDLDGSLEKTPAKIIILADPCLLEKGKFDIDTLFSLTGCKVPVLSPHQLLFDAALGGDKKYFNCGLICDTLYMNNGICQSLFQTRAAEHNIMGAKCFTSATSLKGGVLSGFLDSYTAAGHTEVLNALLVDDWNVDMKELNNELLAIRDFNREEHFRYGKLLAPDFMVFSAAELTMSSCSKLLRDHGLFTHRISQPESIRYVVKPRPDSDGSQFLLIPFENVQD